MLGNGNNKIQEKYDALKGLVGCHEEVTIAEIKDCNWRWKVSMVLARIEIGKGTIQGKSLAEVSSQLPVYSLALSKTVKLVSY